MLMLLHVPDTAGPAWYWWALIAVGAAGVVALGGYLLFRRGKVAKVRRTVPRARK